MDLLDCDTPESVISHKGLSDLKLTLWLLSIIRSVMTSKKPLLIKFGIHHRLESCVKSSLM